MAAYDVTILTLVYNHKAYLPQLFAGMAVQDPRIAVQWYLIDDASPDGSAEVVRTLIDTLPGHIHATLIQNPKNIGATASGIRILAQPIAGRYCMLLEGDDYFKEGFLQKTVQFLDTHPDYASVHTDIDHYIAQDDRFVFDYWRTIGRNTGSGHTTDIPEGDIFEELLKHSFIQTCAFLTRTEIYVRYLDLQTYAEPPFEYHFMDYTLYLNIARTYKIGFIPESLSVYRINLQGMNSNPANRARMHYTTLRMVYDATNGRHI
jgi:glycosyltransferase involved in cell wall biosynthesis